MGYIFRNIATIDEPALVSLAALPNFLQFNKLEAVRTFFKFSVTINIDDFTPGAPALTTFILTDREGEQHVFSGTNFAANARENIYYISNVKSDTAENMRRALMSDAWFRSHFDAVIPISWLNGEPVAGSRIDITSKGAGDEYNIGISAPNNTTDIAYRIDLTSSPSRNRDSISGERDEARVEVELYTNTGIFLGEDDRALTEEEVGDLVLSLEKTYLSNIGKVWFDINAPFKNTIGYNRPPNLPLNRGWFDAGTVQDIRAVAKVHGAANTFTFYNSNVVYLFRGFSNISDAPNLTPYIYDMTRPVMLLNEAVPRPYVRGQRVFVSFILKDPLHSTTIVDNDYFGIEVFATSQSGTRFIALQQYHPKKRTEMSIINSCAVVLDEFIDEYPDAYNIRLRVTYNGNAISSSLLFHHRPECLHKVTNFSFINRLGGWDSFNFDASTKQELKQTPTTYFRTVTPEYKRGDSIETVQATDATCSYTIESAPFDDAVAEWLKRNFVPATVILDDEGNYIIVEDLKFEISDANNGEQTLSLKYRQTETLNNE